MPMERRDRYHGGIAYCIACFERDVMPLDKWRKLQKKRKNEFYRRVILPRISVDFSNVENFEPIPAGRYPAIVTEYDMPDEPGPSGYQNIKWTLAVEDGEHADTKLFTNTSLSPKAAFKVRETLIAFGEDEEKLEGSYDFDPDDYIGAKVYASVTITSYNGRQVNNVESLEPRGKGRATATAGASSGAATQSKRPSLR